MSEEESQNQNSYRYDFKSWEDENINLNTKLLRGLYAYGFENPSAIQLQDSFIKEPSRDIIAQVHSEIGKQVHLL